MVADVGIKWFARTERNARQSEGGEQILSTAHEEFFDLVTD